ncbi:bifunctional class I SAM-dependent methyltransferase/glycosyltransferase family 2 protein [Candidatus Latescibacteria bacterium]|jgi:SAM-dependent methyltransferase|nr:bifunctional class I SAM-dependent methyltransferase/glycosyltransferase family 2 protein [Candidatus Latescibacterota bacterium]
MNDSDNRWASSAEKHKQQIAKHFDGRAADRRPKLLQFRHYHKQLIDYLRFLVPPGASVLELGCGSGEILNALEPAKGVGVDLSEQMVEKARAKFPHLEFRVGDAETYDGEETFEYVLVLGLINHLYDVQQTFAQVRKACDRHTRVIVLNLNFVWQPLFRLLETMRLRKRQPDLNWLPLGDMENLLLINGLEPVKKDYHLLCPFYFPLLSSLANRLLANAPIIWRLCIDQVVVARLQASQREVDDFSCSVIVPARNERGNIEEIVRRIPNMGSHTEIVFVEGGSQDETLAECHRVKKAYPNKDIAVMVQDGIGKGDAVRKGYAAAKGDILMILDADISVDPEELPKFYRALADGKGEFINGTRLVYQMEDQAMRTLNLMGNYFFSRAFSYILEQQLRDTLCGTKVLFKRDYDRLAAGRSYFGNFDPFGDFDLLFGAAKLNLKIVEIPVRYRARTYGSTNIRRFTHGWLLIKMVIFSLRKIKFV